MYSADPCRQERKCADRPSGDLRRAGAGHETEADLKARYAHDELGYDGPIRLDRHSHSTWENIQNAIPLIEEAEVIKIVSISPHAERGRAYLWRLRPDLAHRLQRGEDHRLTEMSVVKALLGFRNARRQVGRDQHAVSVPQDVGAAGQGSRAAR